MFLFAAVKEDYGQQGCYIRSDARIPIGGREIIEFVVARGGGVVKSPAAKVHDSSSCSDCRARRSSVAPTTAVAIYRRI